MPYRRRTYRKRNYRKNPATKVSLAQAKRMIRHEIKKEDRKDHPLQWYDILFTGQYIKTTPLLTSIATAVATDIQGRDGYVSWPQRYDSTHPTNANYRQADVYITGLNWQLRYQQNEQASDVTTDTVRTLLYSFNDTYTENNDPILDGGDIDRPPRTEDVRSMYFDRVFNLKSQITETTADDSEFVPDTRILKGFKKLNHKFTMENRDTAVAVTEGGDIRLEHQSDDNSVIGEVELYGFVRVYFRVMA